MKIIIISLLVFASLQGRGQEVVHPAGVYRGSMRIDTMRIQTDTLKIWALCSYKGEHSSTFSIPLYQIATYFTRVLSLPTSRYAYINGFPVPSNIIIWQTKPY